MLERALSPMNERRTVRTENYGALAPARSRGARAGVHRATMVDDETAQRATRPGGKSWPMPGTRRTPAPILRSRG
jgi:hypothetical protein